MNWKENFVESSEVLHFDPRQRRSEVRLNERDIPANLNERTQELERAVYNLRTEIIALQERLAASEAAVKLLSRRTLARQERLQSGTLLVAKSLRELFEDYHMFKGEVLGLAAHVDRWTRRVNSIIERPPISWIRKFRSKG